MTPFPARFPFFSAQFGQAAQDAFGGALSSAAQWADPPALWALRRWFFPLSRLWAAAGVADGEPAVLAHEAGIAQPGRLWLRTAARLLPSHAKARTSAEAARVRWENELWPQPDAAPTEDPSKLDLWRRRAATRFMAMRAVLYPLYAGNKVAMVKWDLPSPSEMEARCAPALNDPESWFMPPADRTVEESRPAEFSSHTEYWLRFRGVAGDNVYALVTTPKDDSDLPTLILGNGICVEWDLAPRGSGMGRLALERGFRAVEIVAPGHGLRAQPGWYAGERFFAAGPMGALDGLSRQARELGVLIGWARERFGGKIAVGGVSMGALAAQHVLSRSDAWARAMRPDGGLLIGHTGRIDRAGQNGTLARVFGLLPALRGAGWTDADLDRWSAVINPADRLALPPRCVVSVLGRRDRLLPYADGQATVERWRLPPENRFTLPHGHFGLPMGVLHDRRPFERLHEVLS